MKKTIIALLLSAASLSAMASEAVILPYFNTNNNWSARYVIVNPTDERITITANIHDVDGSIKSYNHYVLEPNDMIAASISPTVKKGVSYWYVPLDDKSCKFYENGEVSVTEGYISFTSELFPTFGGGGFCGNTYKTIDPKKLTYEYTLWNEKVKQVFDIRTIIPVNDTVLTSWTRNQGRSTAWVVNLKDFNGQCQSFEYLVSNRDGNLFKTYDVAEPGPAGYKNFDLCHKVNVINFGPPLFDSTVGVSAESQMFFLNNPDMNAGWAKLVAPGSTLSIRSNW